MTVRLIQHNSKEYEQMILLRQQVLLQPIGVPASYIQRDKEKEDILICAFEGETITGCCVLTPKNSNTVQLRQMAVVEHMQGKGVGAAIVAFAENEARNKLFQNLILHARSVVVPFYLKCGYEVVGEEFYEVGIAHRVMQKKLS